MTFLAALWHLVGFFAPALGVGLLAASASKLIWRGELRSVSWLRLAAPAVGGCSLALIAGLLWFGRDGRMATYGAMVLVCAICLWAVGFAGRRR